jgi:hypothetical protein
MTILLLLAVIIIMFALIVLARHLRKQVIGDADEDK